MPTPDFQTLLYTTAGPVATITLNRPEQLNTIVPPMPDEIEAAIGLAERDQDIKVIVLRGAVGRGGNRCCSSYNAKWSLSASSSSISSAGETLRSDGSNLLGLRLRIDGQATARCRQQHLEWGPFRCCW